LPQLHTPDSSPQPCISLTVAVTMGEYALIIACDSGCCCGC
jgi:hypothetical protein